MQSIDRISRYHIAASKRKSTSLKTRLGAILEYHAHYDFQNLHVKALFVVEYRALSVSLFPDRILLFFFFFFIG